MTKRPSFLLSALLLGLLALPGCNDTAYPEDLSYRYEDYQSWDDTKQQMRYVTIRSSKQDQITEALEPYFGTPRYPRVYTAVQGQGDKLKGVMTDEAKALLVGGKEDKKALRLDKDTLERGSKLYRQQCLHCHGLMGSGEGVTGQFLNPKPRDFRQGAFKFVSTSEKDSSGKYLTTSPTAPSRADLLKTLRNGIPTASMPAFNLLPDEDLEALVSYVIHLSLRGQAELALTDEESTKKGFARETIEEKIQGAVRKWHDRSRSDYVPPQPSKPWEQLHADNQRTGRGRAVFLGAGGCVQCHGKDAQASFYEVRDNITRRDQWGNLNAPRNLALGQFRGGSRPIDIFYRIKLGIKASGMPPAAETVTDEDIWYLVDYVLSLPLERVARK